MIATEDFMNALREYVFSTNPKTIDKKLRFSNPFRNEDVYNSFNQGMYRQKLKEKQIKYQFLGGLKQFTTAITFSNIHNNSEKYNIKVKELGEKITELDQEFKNSKAYQYGIKEANKRKIKEYSTIGILGAGSIAGIYHTINQLIN